MNHQRNSRPARLFLTLLAVLALLLASCSDDDPTAGGDIQTNDSSTTLADDSSDDSDDSSTTTSADSDDDDDDSDDDSDDDGDSDDSSDDDSDGDSEIPGEPWDGFAAEGDMFGVVGVAHDDVLNVRALPDAGSEIVTTLEPLATGVEATGEGRLLPSSIWYEVKTGAGTGWINAQFVAFIGGTDDATAEFMDSGAPTSAETMVQLADQVADAFVLDDDVGTRIVQSVAPTVGDLGEITYDVIGLGDDAVGGYRLHIFGAPTEGGEGFEVKTIERTYLCSRGTDGELCF